MLVAVSLRLRAQNARLSGFEGLKGLCEVLTGLPTLAVDGVGDLREISGLGSFCSKRLATAESSRNRKRCTLRQVCFKSNGADMLLQDLCLWWGDSRRCTWWCSAMFAIVLKPAKGIFWVLAYKALFVFIVTTYDNELLPELQQLSLFSKV